MQGKHGEHGLHAAGGPKQVAGLGLGRGDGNLVGAFAEDLLDGAGLADVARWVEVACALMWSTTSGLTPASAMARCMAAIMPSPSSRGAVMWKRRRTSPLL